MDRGAWWATVHGVKKKLDMTERLMQTHKVKIRPCRSSQHSTFRWLPMPLHEKAKNPYDDFQTLHPLATPFTSKSHSQLLSLLLILLLPGGFAFSQACACCLALVLAVPSD